MIKLSLKDVAKEKGISQMELVSKTGIRQPTISAIYNNRCKHLPIDVIDRICRVLNCQPSDWITFVDE